MIYFYESNQDLASRGGGVISWDGNDEELWGEVNANNISNGDIADIIEMIGMPASSQVAQADEEYRDERDGSERLAERHGCWCILPARDIISVSYILRCILPATQQPAVYNLRGDTQYAVYYLRMGERTRCIYTALHNVTQYITRIRSV